MLCVLAFGLDCDGRYAATCDCEVFGILDVVADPSYPSVSGILDDVMRAFCFECIHRS